MKGTKASGLLLTPQHVLSSALLSYEANHHHILSFLEAPKAQYTQTSKSSELTFWNLIFIKQIGLMSLKALQISTQTSLHPTLNLIYLTSQALIA